MGAIRLKCWASSLIRQEKSLASISCLTRSQRGQFFNVNSLHSFTGCHFPAAVNGFSTSLTLARSSGFGIVAAHAFALARLLMALLFASSE